MFDGIEFVSLFGDFYIVVFWWLDIVFGMFEVFDWLGEEFCMGYFLVIIVIGFSVIVDMGVLVKGVYGLKDVYVVIFDE